MVEIAWFWMIPAALSAAFSLSAGNAQSSQYKSEALAADLEARVAELGIKQTTASRLKGLQADIGAIRARRAAQNVAASSGSAVAAEAGYENEYLAKLRADILSQRYNVVGIRSKASSLRVAAKNAKISGYANAITSIVSSYSAFGGGGLGGASGGAGSSLGSSVLSKVR